MRHFLLLLALLVAIPAAAQQGNLSGFVLPAAARTAATVTSVDQSNLSWKGGQFIVNATSYVSGNYTVVVQGKDPVSGNYYTILQSPAISGNGTTVVQVYPGLSATATSVNGLLPKVWRVQLNGASTPSMTLSVGIQLIQ